MKKSTHFLISRYIARAGKWGILSDDIDTFINTLSDEKAHILHQRQKQFRDFLCTLREQYPHSDTLDTVSQTMAVRGMFRLRASEFIHARETRLSLKTLQCHLDKAITNRTSLGHDDTKITDADMTVS